MKEKPRHPEKDKMVNGFVLMYSYGYVGILQMIFCWIFYFTVTPNLDVVCPSRNILQLNCKNPNTYTPADENYVREGMTVYYWTLVMGQIAAAISTTTKKQSLFLPPKPYCFPNMVLNLMFLLEIAVGLAAIYSSYMQDPFMTESLPAYSVCMPALTLVGIVTIEEIRKAIVRSRDHDDDESAESAEGLVSEEESGTSSEEDVGCFGRGRHRDDESAE